MGIRLMAALLLASGAIPVATAAPAVARPYGAPPPLPPREVFVGGTGATALDPWLAFTEEGQRLVLARFDHNGNGEIGERGAAEANAWFRRFADRNRDGRLTDREVEWGLEQLGGPGGYWYSPCYGRGRTC